jgi:hypothetical protein|tara:strand:+ start:3527 stop:3805 length:279 start_codon:yes stop_codon:yes gene_type:complete
MVSVYKNEDGFVHAYVDYQIVDNKGVPKQDGEYCWVNNVWAHKTMRRRDILKSFVEREHAKYPTVKWIYWMRTKHDDRMSIYDIKRLYKKEK